MKLPSNMEEFRRSLELDSPPAVWPESYKAMWWDAHGNWTNAHEIAQDIVSETGNWIHAYLHRKEGDQWNAGYWYSRANKSFPNESLDEEFTTIIRSLLHNP